MKFISGDLFVLFRKKSQDFYDLTMPTPAYENLDLKRERQNCDFVKEEITNLIDGGVEKTKYRREIGKNIFLPYSVCQYSLHLNFHPLLAQYILSQQDLRDPIPIEYLSHDERYAAELRKACLLVRKLQAPLPKGQFETVR